MLTRFAPAPTGYLHLGHVANALRVWGEARARGGRVLLRIEDHDRERCRPEYETALLDDLDWLGFVPDVNPTAVFRAGRCESRQSDRGAIYQGAADRLRALGLIYACKCSRNDLAAAWEKSRKETTSEVVSGIWYMKRPQRSLDQRSLELPYPGTCRELDLPFDDGVGWRVRLPPDVITFEDRWCGPQVQTPAEQCGDILIRDRLGNWTYQFTAAVDDHLQGITDVIRGVDLLSSTGRQVLLARLLGRETPPAFAHHPLIMKSPTQKLSKSDKDTGIRDLRSAGWSRERVLEAAIDMMSDAAGGRA
jgi:glutamyl/glutaminyl-tRNA synthetase